MDILCRIIPVEQTKNIPLLAENLTWTLFGKKGEQKTFTIRETETDKQKTDTWKSLGLDPAKTCLIGHSHGAHIAGLTGMYSIRDSYGTIKRIIALDPSNQNCHQFDGNKNGKGWNRDAADYLDVYRTTWLFSANILYGDLNLHIINKNHPHVCMKKPEQSDVIMNAPYIVSYLTGYFLTEYNDHVGVYEYFVKMMVKDRTLHQLDYKTDKPNNKWIIRYKMKEKSKMKNPKLKW